MSKILSAAEALELTKQYNKEEFHIVQRLRQME